MRILKYGMIGSVIGVCISSTYAADLTINIENIQSNQGNVFIALFSEPTGFPMQPPKSALIKSMPAKVGGASVTYQNIEAGRYAVALYQDRNNNQRLDTSFIGMPKEPYGFSNDAKVRFSAPSFQEAAFKIEEKISAKHIRIVVVN